MASRPHPSSASSRTTRARGAGGKFTSTIPAHERKCSRCGTDQTSQWRTSTDGKPLCNRCGIRLMREAQAQQNSRKKEPTVASSSRNTIQSLLNPTNPPRSNSSRLPPISSMLQNNGHSSRTHR